MRHLIRGPLASPVVLLVALATAVSVSLVSGATATSTTTTTTSSATAERTVARGPLGTVKSRVRGTTANGRDVRGSFVPLKVVERNGRLKVRGLIQGVVRNRDGSTRTFAAMRTIRVRSVDGQPLTAAGAARNHAACDVLHLVLGPLDLDLLGLQVHLDRVVLDIVAQPGPGNLLGNLLCAVAGLLDGGLDGALGRVVRLLNRILARLGLGL